MLEELKDYCHEGAHPAIVINKARHLSKEQTLEVLLALRERIAGGEPLLAEDSNITGMKFTEVTWGMCCGDQKIYSDPKLHRFPQDFLKDLRTSPLNQHPQHPCPMRAALEPEENGSWGCFYKCAVFGNRRNMTQDEALARYDAGIEKLKAAL